MEKKQRKLFGSTQYVEIGKDVEPNEEYLQLSVLNMWDFDNEAKKFHEFGFQYVINICKRVNNKDSYTSKRAKTEDLTKEEIDFIYKYINR